MVWGCLNLGVCLRKLWKRVPLVVHFTWGPTANARASVRTHILWTFSSSRKLLTWPTYLHRLLKRVLEWGKEKGNETVGGRERTRREGVESSRLMQHPAGSYRWERGAGVTQVGRNSLIPPLSISKCFMAWLYYTQYFWRINKRSKNYDI